MEIGNGDGNGGQSNAVWRDPLPFAVVMLSVLNGSEVV